MQAYVRLATCEETTKRETARRCDTASRQTGWANSGNGIPTTPPITTRNVYVTGILHVWERVPIASRDTICCIDPSLWCIFRLAWETNLLQCEQGISMARGRKWLLLRELSGKTKVTFLVGVYILVQHIIIIFQTCFLMDVASCV